jgi:hypothetical protein
MLDKFLNTVSKEKGEYLLVGLISLFIISETEINDEIANMVDNIFVKALLYLGAFYLLTVHKVLGGVAIVGVFELIRRCESKTGKVMMKKYLPSQANKDRHLNALNQFPVTLEEEMVHKMVPVTNNTPLPKATYKPILSSNKGALSL